MRKLLSWSSLARLITALLLLGALDSMPSDYYMILRIVTCAVAAHTAFIAGGTGRTRWAWILGILALVFNPLLPIYLERDTWALIDLAACLTLIVSIRFVRSVPKDAKVPAEPEREPASGSILVVNEPSEKEKRLSELEAMREAPAFKDRPGFEQNKIVREIVDLRYERKPSKKVSIANPHQPMQQQPTAAKQALLPSSAPKVTWKDRVLTVLMMPVGFAAALGPVWLIWWLVARGEDAAGRGLRSLIKTYHIPPILIYTLPGLICLLVVGMPSALEYAIDYFAYLRRSPKSRRSSEPKA